MSGSFRLPICFQLLAFLLGTIAVIAADSDLDRCFVPTAGGEDNNPCPPWFILTTIPGDNTTVECLRGPRTSGTISDPKTCTTSIHLGRCLTYNPVTKSQVDGVCSLQKNPQKYITLPANVSELNNFMCGGLNREGQLCGACKEGYGPALLTYR